MPFSDFHVEPEICLSVNRIELNIKYQKIVTQKLYLMRKQKSGPRKMANTWMKNYKKMTKIR